jgi:hypothetical protein
MLVSCMSLFTKHNYRAKKLNNLTLRGKSNVNGLYIRVRNIVTIEIVNRLTLAKKHCATFFCPRLHLLHFWGNLNVCQLKINNE